jgi:hypothetical protein
MKRMLILGMVLLCSACFAVLPNPHIYEWGKLAVPENYNFSASQKLEIYWEKLNLGIHLTQALSSLYPSAVNYT